MSALGGGGVFLRGLDTKGSEGKCGIIHQAVQHLFHFYGALLLVVGTRRIVNHVMKKDGEFGGDRLLKSCFQFVKPIQHGSNVADIVIVTVASGILGKQIIPDFGGFLGIQIKVRR